MARAGVWGAGRGLWEGLFWGVTRKHKKTGAARIRRGVPPGAGRGAGAPAGFLAVLARATKPRKQKRPDELQRITAALLELREELDFALETLFQTRCEMAGVNPDPDPRPRPRFQVIDGGRDDLNP